MKRSLSSNHRFQDLTGIRFGSLVVIDLATIERKVTYWTCRCDCNTERCFASGNLKSGRSQSCGCQSRVRPRVSEISSGLSSEYKCWTTIIQRCTNPRNPGYRFYGGNGVLVAPKWRISFDEFIADMGLRPSPSHFLERYPILDGPFSPENCRWSTR